MKKSKGQIVNYGIYGTTTAEVIAVGDKAHAQKTVSGSKAEQLEHAIEELRRLLQHQNIPSHARKDLEKELDSLGGEVKRAPPRKKQIASSLKRLQSILKTAGGIASDTAKLVAPIKRIAQAVGLALGAVGLS
jgi:hypothetical protein